MDVSKERSEGAGAQSSQDRIVISQAEAEAWLSRYKSALEGHDVAAMLALFSEGADYRERRFGEPLLGHDSFEAYWRDRICAPQHDIVFTFEVWGVRGSEVMTRWQTVFTLDTIGTVMQMDGIMHVVFDGRNADGLVAGALDQWFDTAQRPSKKDLFDTTLSTRPDGQVDPAFRITRDEADHWLGRIVQEIRGGDLDALMALFTPDIRFRLTGFTAELSGRDLLKTLSDQQLLAHVEDFDVEFEIWGIRDDELLAFWRGSYFWKPTNDFIELDGIVSIGFGARTSETLLASRFVRWFDQTG